MGAYLKISDFTDNSKHIWWHKYHIHKFSFLNVPFFPVELTFCSLDATDALISVVLFLLKSLQLQSSLYPRPNVMLQSFNQFSFLTQWLTVMTECLRLSHDNPSSPQGWSPLQDLAGHPAAQRAREAEGRRTLGRWCMIGLDGLQLWKICRNTHTSTHYQSCILVSLSVSLSAGEVVKCLSAFLCWLSESLLDCASPYRVRLDQTKAL